MDIRTENLTILFVDIAGFTATTSRQSRAENANLLHTFDRTLQPLVKAFKGTVVKSIGDALLVTVRSPTDAMLCAMALQDAMHAHNLNLAEEQRIHIRVAASLGEVRVAKGDIFGEPVNVAARIEGVTPADEIYLSEAVYLAMNKAEVPAEEVGFRELSGIPHAIRLYSIPRFATRRLISENVLPPEAGSEILYPYGGMHRRVPHLASLLHHPLRGLAGPAGRRLGAYGLAGLAGLALVLAWWLGRAPEPVPATATAPTAAALPAPSPPQAPAAAPVQSQSQPQPTKPAASWPTVKPAAAPVASEPAPKPEATAGSKPPAAPAKIAAPAVAALSEPTPAAAPPPWNVTRAKLAYRAGRLSKAEYRAVLQKLGLEYENRVRQLKLDYRAGKLSREDYARQVREAKLAFKGG